MTTPIFLFGQFTATKVGKTGLTDVTVDVDAYELATGTRTSPVTGSAAVEARNGIYFYRVAAADPSLYDYTATFKTADATVDAKHVPSWRGSLEAIMAAIIAAYLDAAVSTRLASASYTTPPTVGAISDQVWEELAADHDTALTTGALLGTAGAAADPLLNPVAGYAPGTAGAALQRIGNTSIPVQSVLDPATMALHYLHGNDYSALDNRHEDFTTTHDLTGGSVSWRIQAATGPVVVACAIISSGPDGSTYRLAPTAAQLATIGINTWKYELEMVLAAGRTITEYEGYVTIDPDVR